MTRDEMIAAMRVLSNAFKCLGIKGAKNCQHYAREQKNGMWCRCCAQRVYGNLMDDMSTHDCDGTLL